jgi:atypical dual specificity phosphatase
VNPAHFGPIDGDAPVCGACRPGHLGGGLDEGVRILVDGEVATVVCLLSEGEAGRWGLPDAYDDAFRTAHVPIRDRHLPTPERLARAVDLIGTAADEGGRVALHCNAGLGRTGVVAAAWLVRDRGHAPASAIDLVEAGPMPRAPREAVREGNATEAELHDLLECV